jgi:hypothetical protein
MPGEDGAAAVGGLDGAEDEELLPDDEQAEASASRPTADTTPATRAVEGIPGLTMIVPPSAVGGRRTSTDGT